MEYEINDLLDRIKADYHIGSDYKLAQFLGIVNGSIRHYRHGRSLPDLRVTERIAFQLRLDPDVLWAHFQAQRAPDAHAAEVWTRIAKRLREAGQAAVMTLVGMAVVLGFITTPPNAHAVVTDRATSSPLYIMYTLMNRAFRAIRRFRRNSRPGTLTGQYKTGSFDVPRAWSFAPAVAFA